MAKPKVAVVMGSKSDLPVMQEAMRILEELGIEYEAKVLSAHRTPEETSRYASSAQGRGIQVIIAGAGAAAHLAGAIASRTVLPVLGVPLAGSPLGGVDALYSTVQMPGGIPVGTLGIGISGAKNAAILAGEIIALGDAGVKNKVASYREKLRAKALKKHKL